ncbi:glycosyltransferase family 4 protein [Methylomonas fluvii]|uniref:Glycosyltransferase family 4 protein n=1 Tax=Methylomonas fluvii TaxID=1854564 RepID=A0ABR9DH84_9GAMM|nr:glycosyltransferase family 1 protein [Methylomonas fluvii]MBD9362458.1 glycosyltransferase family 4 protein [Methylomonas fluvii]CAD6875560.1 group 1 glycosyl transferase [Methylomonas fluvii]
MDIILSTDAIRQPLTGIGRYTSQLARQLAQHPEIGEIWFSHGGKLLPQIPEARHRPAVVTWLRDSFSKYSPLLDAYRKMHSVGKARSIQHVNNALYHGTNYYLPKFAGRSVVTIHDISVFTLPECHRADRVNFLRKEMALALERATAVITVSEFSKREIMAYFNWPAERIFVTPLASAGIFYPRSAPELAPLLNASQLNPGSYCLYVGTLEPRKNLGVLLDAYAGLPLPLRRLYPLVLSGHSGWNSQALHDRIRQAEQEGWLRYLGFVPDARLPALMAGARLFVFPSFYEGFGLPVLEAMSSSVPVICANTASLPEVAGNAAAMFAPQDTDRLAELIAMGLKNEEWRSAATQNGLRQAACFSWEKCTELTLLAYAAALSD